MSDKDYTVVRSLNGGNGLPDRLAVYDRFASIGDRPVEVETGLVSLGFLRVALRRRARLWCVLALLGLLGGAGYTVSSPAPYKAAASLLLTPGPYENINTAASNDQAMAESRTVAGLAVQRLGLNQSAASFLTTYTVAPITERVLNITVSAKTSAEAQLRAGAIAAAFLQFRASEMQSEQKLVLASLNQQLSQAQQRFSSLDAQISQLESQSGSSGDSAQVKGLKAQRTQASSAVYNLQQAVIGNQTVTQPATAAAVNGSVVLDQATPLAHSRFKPLVLNSAIGLIAGLVLGMAIVIIQALVTDRLRRRDDIAQALGAPVKVSVGPIRQNRRLPSLGGGSATGDQSVQRIATHLGRIVPAPASSTNGGGTNGDGTGGTASLAVVAVDDTQVPALALVSLATFSAAAGKQVVVADLCRGAPAAKLLGVAATGVHVVSDYDARLAVAVPLGDEVVPTGPLGARPDPARLSEYAAALAAASDAADLLLTLVALDPALGGDHLTTWATDAVVLVTAGRSSWTMIRAVSEMIRLSGARLASAVLVGTDKTDESLGLVPTLDSV